MEIGAASLVGVPRPGQVARGPEALLRAIDRPPLAHLGPNLLAHLQRGRGIDRRSPDPGQHPDAVHGRLLVRLPLEGARVVDGVDVVLLILVVHEGQPVRLARPRQDGRERGDALDAGVEVGELVDLALAQVVQEDVAHAAAVGDERDGPAVRCPLRAHVLALLHVVEDLYRPRRQIEQRDAEIAEGEGLEVGVRPAVRGERDGLPVRRPDRVEVPVLVGRQPPQVGAVAVDVYRSLIPPS